MSEKQIGLFSILFTWRNFIIIPFIFAALLTTTVTFLIPETFRSVATIMITSSSNPFSVGALLGNIGGGVLGSLGGLGAGFTDESDRMLGILNSEKVAIQIIKEFDLVNYYEVDDNNLDKVLKAYYTDVEFEINKNGMLEIAVVNKSPNSAAQIANRFIEILDSINIILATNEAKFNRQYIEQRYEKNISDLSLAEEQLNQFQKQNGVLIIPEQIEASISVEAGLESQLIQGEILAEDIKTKIGLNSSAYQDAKRQLEFLKSKLQDIKLGKNRSVDNSVILASTKTPDLALEYFRLFREVEIQSKILEILLPIYEQSKVEENKNIPTIQILDDARPPQLKHRPRKLLIILTVSFLVLVVFTYIALIGHSAIKNDVGSEYEQKKALFFKHIVNLFRVRVQA